MKRKGRREMVSGSRTRCPFHPVYFFPSFEKREMKTGHTGYGRRRATDSSLNPPVQEHAGCAVELAAHVFSNPAIDQVAFFDVLGYACEERGSWYVECWLGNWREGFFPPSSLHSYHERIEKDCVGSE